MDILKVISDELNIKLSQVEATVKLIDEGNTIPFIARYRKEVTGSLNDEVLRNLDERLKYLRNLEDRKATVIASIEEQGKLTEELKKQIEEAENDLEIFFHYTLFFWFLSGFTYLLWASLFIYLCDYTQPVF